MPRMRTGNFGHRELIIWGLSVAESPPRSRRRLAWCAFDLVDSPPTGQQAPPATESTRRDLDRSLVSGVFWTGSARLGVQVVSWVAMVLLAKLLAPEDFGLLGMTDLSRIDGPAE